MMKLRTDRRSLAIQLRDRIRDMLATKNFKAGDQLPSEEKLASMYGVSRATVREALKYLEEEHIVICRHGSGRFLAPGPSNILEEEVTKLQSVTEMAQGLGINLSTKVLSFSKEPANEIIQSRLNLNPGCCVYVLERARMTQNETIIYSIDIFPDSLVKGEIKAADFKGSLASIMESKWKVRMSYSRADISAVLLNPEICERINVKSIDPWILLEQVNFNEKDQPFLYSKDYHRSEKIQFHVIRRRR